MPPAEAAPKPDYPPNWEDLDIMYSLHRDPEEVRREIEIIRRTSERMIADPVLADAALRRIGLLPPKDS